MYVAVLIDRDFFETFDFTKRIACKDIEHFDIEIWYMYNKELQIRWGHLMETFIEKFDKNNIF